MQSDWTIAKTLEVVAPHYPKNRRRALDAIRQNARAGRIRISGCRCMWRLSGGPEDVQEREEIPPLMWVDIALCRLAFEWAAANKCEFREFDAYQYDRIVRPGLRSNPEIRQGSRAVVPRKQRTELSGWCSLRVDSAEALAVFQQESQSPNRVAKELLTPIRGGSTPLPELPSGARTNKAASAEQACGTHLRNLKERPKNKDEAYLAAAAAVADVGQLSRKAFDRAWANNVREDWKLSGRPKRPRKSSPQ